MKRIKLHSAQILLKQGKVKTDSKQVSHQSSMQKLAAKAEIKAEAEALI